MNFLSRMMTSLLASSDSAWRGELSQTLKDAFNVVTRIINIVMPILLSLVLVAGLIYAITLGVKYSKAEETQDKENAKQALINCVVGFVITLVLIAIIYVVLRNIEPIYRAITGLGK